MHDVKSRPRPIPDESEPPHERGRRGAARLAPPRRRKGAVAIRHHHLQLSILRRLVEDSVAPVVDERAFGTMCSEGILRDSAAQLVRPQGAVAAPDSSNVSAQCHGARGLGRVARDISECSSHGGVGAVPARVQELALPHLEVGVVCSAGKRPRHIIALGVLERGGGGVCAAGIH